MPAQAATLEQDPFYGLISMGETETDYQLLAGEVDLPLARHTWAENQFAYQQTKVSKSSCSVHGAFGTLSDLFGKELATEQLEKAWGLALTLGAKEGKGWYGARAVDLARDLSVEFFGEEVSSWELELGSEEYFLALEKGYSIVVSYYGNKDFKSDRNDGRLDKVSFGKATNGHCVRMAKGPKGGNSVYLIVDSYPETRPESNVYEIPMENIDDLVRNGVFGRLGYVFAIKADMDAQDLLLTVPVWATKSWAKALAKKLSVVNGDPMEVVCDSTVEKAFVELGVLSKEEGNVTRARLAVALDRAGFLD